MYMCVLKLNKKHEDKTVYPIKCDRVLTYTHIKSDSL